MRRIAACVLVLAMAFASVLAAAQPRVARGAEEVARLVAPTRTEAPVCGGAGYSAAKEFDVVASPWPCVSLSCLVGGNAGCTLACIASGDEGGGCRNNCCFCAGDPEMQ